MLLFWALLSEYSVGVEDSYNPFLCRGGFMIEEKIFKSPTEQRKRCLIWDQTVSKCMFLLLLTLICHTTGAVGDQQEGRVLIAVYAAGGSLETDYGLITDDISQMVTGIGNTTPDTLEILVAYGGSKKPGWEGMTIQNISGLAADLADDDSLNRSEVLARFPEASMGSSAALGEFLSWIHTHYHYDRIFLVLIGHGEAYTGMLFDQNHKDDPLTLPELVKALQIGGFNVELIGFDTCLMSSLEVASVVSGYASYMIASEESEPAEGWQYETLVSYLAENPDAPAEGYGDALLQSYLQNPIQGKTLSLLKLDEAGSVTASLDRLSKELIPILATSSGYRTLAQAFNSSQQFGLNGDGTLDPATMDLVDVAEQIGLVDPVLLESTTDLIDATRRMVILSVHDDAVPRAYGVAILSPVQINSGFYRFYRDEAAITPAWDRFMTRYLEFSDNLMNITSGSPMDGLSSHQ
ncbi:MAG: hypothetical protein CVV33_03015 [Methanomicrobiales archaeon HGW-Methanomicrobiales-4]|nr:MAG: hypothetical protein CVV33_03015 [Methanomicrobiales archaeon HGW-Methanomicrobiales-4]